MDASCPSVSVRPLSRAHRGVQCKQVKAVALTIRAHLVELSCLHHCLKKLGVNRRSAVVIWARERGDRVTGYPSKTPLLVRSY